MNSPRLEYFGDTAKAAELKGKALGFYQFVLMSMGGVRTVQREKRVGDAIIRVNVWSDAYDVVSGAIQIYVPMFGGGVEVFPDITYPDRWSSYVTLNPMYYDLIGRIERHKPFEPMPVTYYAGGCLMQSISEISSPNKSCIGGYWHAGKAIIGWSRDRVCIAGVSHRIEWITTDYNYSIQACSISGKDVILITGKQQDAWDFALDNYMYGSISITDIKLWKYELSGESLNLIKSYFIFQSAGINEINIGFLSNYKEFYLYSRLQTGVGTKKLTKYTLNSDFDIETSNIVYSIDTFSDDGIDAIINNNAGQSLVSIRSGGSCGLNLLVDNSIIPLDTEKYKNIPSSISMMMFCDIKRQVYIYTAIAAPFYRLSYKGVEHDIDAIPITDYDDRIINNNDDCPNVNNDQFTYAYNGSFIVFCFKLFTMVLDCSKTEPVYKKYNYRFDAFKISDDVHYSPLSLIESSIE